MCFARICAPHIRARCPCRRHKRALGLLDLQLQVMICPGCQESNLRPLKSSKCSEWLSHLASSFPNTAPPPPPPPPEAGSYNRVWLLVWYLLHSLVGLELLEILLPQAPKFWDCKCGCHVPIGRIHGSSELPVVNQAVMPALKGAASSWVLLCL